MRNARKRPLDEDSSSSSSKMNLNKKHPHSSSRSLDYPIESNHVASHHDSHHPISSKRLKFTSYTEVSTLTPKLKILCEIIANTPAATVERVLEDTGIRVSQQNVEEVLTLSYGFPVPAVKFFRWSSFQLNDKHSPYSWNLVVDILGKNCLFDAMWDAIKSMRKEMLLSLSTFASVFSSYAISHRVQEAILSFEVMDQYGVPRDVAALNSLLHAITREGKTAVAKDYADVMKDKIRFDSETYAILLEGAENEGDVGRAKQTFSNMVADIGWNPRNMAAYDSFLCTLLKGVDGMHEVLKFFDTMKDRACYPGMKFLKFAIDECVMKSDSKGAKVIWEEMVGKNICRPNNEMCRSLISLYCNLKDFESAEKLLDEMVFYGVFPDSETYNSIFHFSIKHRRIKNAIPIFKEMVKNEFAPMHQDCSAAVKAYIDGGDPHMAIKVWRYMTDTYSTDLDETGNLLVTGLRDMNRVPEAVKCAEDIIERGIKLNSATLTKLKQSLSKVGKASIYEELLRKWKYH
ncbi:pentatricopeptide repeat-containing protein mitochondrial-like [Dorcoceras hygrometricum]|uniref:Pentatricopeptide repeat-containing protein mitochondrial-like n=1 Tax=Dorcoceras hygrometricum TaxID=472368 RepID=A0A2Z7C5S4_9LAMI|nr:pentatricopeptide repeat-containing protein mitochondrial-like [Dorcoceras hygrometricum]